MITTIDRTHAAAVGHFELREPRMGQSSRMAISQGESCRPPSPSDTTTSSRFVSVEEQIERSKAHWSTLAEQSSSGLGEEGEGDCEAEESNKQEFMDLHRHLTWDTFFNTFGCATEILLSHGELVLGEKFAEGWEAEFFHAKVKWWHPEINEMFESRGREFVVKVFKKGTFLRGLKSQWPNGVLQFHVEDMENLKSSTPKVTPRYFCKVYRGILLENGQFAFLMLKDDMDLRSLIERNMESRSGDCGPFSKEDRDAVKEMVKYFSKESVECSADNRSVAKEADHTTTSWRFVSAVEELMEHSKTHWSTLAEQSSSGLGEEGEGDCEAEESNKQEFMDLQRHPTWGAFFPSREPAPPGPSSPVPLTTDVSDDQSMAEMFRFHPTDEKLESFCLMNNALSVCARVFAPIAYVNAYKFDPWDLNEDQLGERAQAFAETLKKVAAILSTGIYKCRRFLPGNTSVSMSKFPLPEFGEKELLESLDLWIKRHRCSARQLKKTRLEEEQINPSFPIWESVELMLQLAEGMKNMPPKGMIHRDLKPLNVLGKRVHDPERFYTVKLVDFGISKAKVSKYSHSTLNSGTSRWMAPELIKMADADHKSPICGLPKLKNEAPNHSLFKTPDQGTRGWSVNEIRTMLELTEEALKVDRGPDIWDYVSENLWEHYEFDRASTSCENMWGILLQSYKETQASTEFELEYRNIIERILTRKLFDDGRNDAGFSLSAPASPLCPFQSSASDMVQFVSTCCDEMLYDEATDEEMEEVDIHSQDEELSGDSTATFESQVETHFSRINEPDYETNSNNAGRKMSADIIMEDELISRIAPFVNKQIEDTLKPLLSVLRKREEDDHKHRQKLLTINEEKLALKREKISFAHRVLANF